MGTQEKSPERLQAEAMAMETTLDGGWTHNRRSISEATGLSKGQSCHYMRQVRKLAGGGAAEMVVEEVDFGQPTETPPVVEPAEDPSTPVYSTAGEAFRAFVGALEEPAFKRRVGKPKRGTPIAILSDIHGPWHDPDKVAKACDEAEAAGCEELIVSGDLFEYHRISRHHKSKSCTFAEEMAGCRALAEYLAGRFKVKRYFKGNHENRWEAYVADNVADEIRFLVPDATKLILDGLGFEPVGHKVKLGSIEHDMVWLAQVGKDAILTHCQLGSAQQGVNLERLKHWLQEWGAALGFAPHPRFILTGHTHRGTTHHEHDRLLVEAGYLASIDIQNYQYRAPGGANLVNRKPGTHGWTLLVQEDGVTDLSRSGFRRLDK